MRKHVSVFVRVNVSDSNSSGLDLADLGLRLAADFFLGKTFLDCGQRKFFQAALESCSVGQSRQAPTERLSINQDHMAADS